MSQDAENEFRVEILRMVRKISNLSPQPKVPRDPKTQAKRMRSILRIAKKAMESDDPTINKKRLADFIIFLEKETKKDKPSEAELREYLRTEKA